MGLGLSICRSIIDAHEGKIWATNNADCGATFYFSLPIDSRKEDSDYCVTVPLPPNATVFVVDVSKTVQAMKHGAFDFLTKPVNAKNLLPAIHAAIERDAVTRREQANLSEICARLATLTTRERDVLEHVVTGKLNKQIASDLGITEATVKMHRAHVMAKMKVQAVADLVRLAELCGIRGSSRVTGSGNKQTETAIC